MVAQATQQTSERVTNPNSTQNYSVAARQVMLYALGDEVGFKAEIAEMRDYLKQGLTHVSPGRRDARYATSTRLFGLNATIQPESHATAQQASWQGANGVARKASNARPLDSWAKVFILDMLTHGTRLAHGGDVHSVKVDGMTNFLAFAHKVARIEADGLLSRLTYAANQITRHDPENPLRDSGLSIKFVKSIHDKTVICAVLSVPGMDMYVTGYSIAPIATN